MGDFTVFSYSTAAGFTWWNLLPSAVGAVLGATASLGPAFLIARHTRKQTQKAATRKGMVKLSMMVNAAEAVHRAIEDSIEEKEPLLGKGGPMWEKVLPMTGHSVTETRFEADELAIFMDREEDSPFGNQMILAGERYVSMQHAVADYNRRRLAFTDLVSDQLSKHPNGKLPTEVKKALDLRAIEVEALAVGIRKEAEEVFGMLVDLAHDFGPKVRTIFKDPKFPRLDVAEARKRIAARKLPDQPEQGSTTKGKA